VLGTIDKVTTSQPCIREPEVTLLHDCGPLVTAALPGGAPPAAPLLSVGCQQTTNKQYKVSEKCHC